jgi:metallo-beta-lactamase family protein
MKITFHGAAQVVTGSKHLLELNNGKKILLDCGMFQGNPKEAEKLNRDWGFQPSQVDALLLSHAHIDHCGLIPKLVNDGFRGKIFCTPATKELARLLLLDSARIQDHDIEYLNRKRKRQGKPPLEVLYTEEDARRCIKNFVAVPYHQRFTLFHLAEVVFTDAGHIVGSAVVNISVKAEHQQKPIQIAYSGDVGKYKNEILKSPEPFPQADYIILESTYGSSLHPDAETNTQLLLDIIVQTCVKQKGRLIIPAFSVGRTQEIVYALNKLEIAGKLPLINYYVDSPLSVEVTEILRQHTECYNEQFREYIKTDRLPFDFHRLHYITDVNESIALNRQDEPCVIISASGMADAGRVKHHIKHAIGDKRNTILIVGYCEPHSLGAKLAQGMKEVTIFGDRFWVNARVEVMNSFSAHADYDDLMQFLSCQNPEKCKQLFLVHGAPEVQEIFRDKLVKRGFKNVSIPALHQTYELHHE